MAAKAKEKKTKEQIKEESGASNLTERQKEFCRQYLTNGFKGTKAVYAAGYEVTSDKAASVQAARLLGDARIGEFMATLQKPALDKFEITQDRIMREVALLAFSNIGDFMVRDAETGQAWIDVTKASHEELAALEVFEVVELPPSKIVIEGQEVEREVLRTKIKMRDKWSPLEALMKRANLLQEKVTVEHEFADMDKNEIARRVAFMLRSAGENKPKSTDEAAVMSESVPEVVEKPVAKAKKKSMRKKAS